MPQVFKPSSNSIAKIAVMSIAAFPFVAGLGLAVMSRSPMNTKVEVPRNQPVPFSHQHHAWELGIDCRYCHVGVEKSAFAGVPGSETCMSCHSQIWTNSPLLEPVRKSYETGTPIRWVRVNKLPEFVFFNHSIHITRGINCNTCHGPVEDMPITYKGNSFQMAWCLDCHRAPEKFLSRNEDPNDPKMATMSPRDQVFHTYWKLQSGKDLSARDKELMRGDLAPATGEELDKGREVVSAYGVKVQQLADCSVCHR